jgi:hypothetical protein
MKMIMNVTYTDMEVGVRDLFLGTILAFDDKLRKITKNPVRIGSSSAETRTEYISNTGLVG